MPSAAIEPSSGVDDQADAQASPSLGLTSFYGFSSFNDLLEEAQARGQLELELAERSGGYMVVRVTERGGARGASALSAAVLLSLATTRCRAELDCYMFAHTCS